MSNRGLDFGLGPGGLDCVGEAAALPCVGEVVGLCCVGMAVGVCSVVVVFDVDSGDARGGVNVTVPLTVGTGLVDETELPKYSEPDGQPNDEQASTEQQPLYAGVAHVYQLYPLGHEPCTSVISPVF